MVTVVCNIFINSDFKFELFKQTFPRVYGVSDNWLINIRGKYSREVLTYIHETFGDSGKNCIFFSELYNNNWAKSTRKMLESSRYDYIYVFLEDHFLLKPIDHFKDVIQDMIDSKIEYFAYSFFDIGLSMKSAEGLGSDYSRHFYSFHLSEDRLWYLKKANKNFYPYSLASVCTKEYFKKILSVENKFLVWVPLFVQTIMDNIIFFYPRNRKFWSMINRLFIPCGVRFGIYTPASPFNLERSLFDIEERFLPIRVGGLKEELFANWDDDNGRSNSSLVKRGLYPMTLQARGDAKGYFKIVEKECFIERGEVEEGRFCPEIGRVSDIPLKRLVVKSGRMRVFSEKESYESREGEDLLIYASVPHRIEALEDVVFLVEVLWK
ncbi:MAG: hypothetical protein WAU28_05000 [Candidatus Moraniibacteriota bacterium]